MVGLDLAISAVVYGLHMTVVDGRIEIGRWHFFKASRSFRPYREAPKIGGFRSCILAIGNESNEQ